MFAYADVQILVYTLEANGVHALSVEGDAEFYADDERERYSEEFLLENRELETDFTKDSKSCQPTCNFQSSVRMITTTDSLITIVSINQKSS